MYQYRSDEIAEHTDSLAYYRRRACCNRQRHIRRLHIVHPHTPEGVQRLFFLVKIIDKLFHLCTEGVEGAPVTLNGENAVMENFFVVIVFITGVLDG